MEIGVTDEDATARIDTSNAARGQLYGDGACDPPNPVPGEAKKKAATAAVGSENFSGTLAMGGELTALRFFVGRNRQSWHVPSVDFCGKKYIIA
jgi:hypothetical protein